MALFDSTKEYILNNITDNDNGEITAEKIRTVLLDIINKTETKIETIDSTLNDIVIDYENND